MSLPEVKIPPIQLHQFGILLVLVWLGKRYANLYPDGWLIAALLVWAFLLEHAWLFWRYGPIRRRSDFSWSALSTTLGIVLMMASAQPFPYLVAVTWALTQKHLIRIGRYHFFNPSNVALIVALLLFYNQAHLIMGQMGQSLWLQGVVLVLAATILMRVDRWIIPVVFAACYVWGQSQWIVGYDPMITFREVAERFYSVSFTVFMAFMLTDPHTTPSKRTHQMVFGLVVALMTVALDRWSGFRVQHPFMALMAASVWGVPLRIEPALRRRALVGSSVLFLLALSAIIYLENLPPYYLEMEGT
jgi:hypothetical protein